MNCIEICVTNFALFLESSILQCCKCLGLEVEKKPIKEKID